MLREAPFAFRRATAGHVPIIEECLIMTAGDTDQPAPVAPPPTRIYSAQLDAVMCPVCAAHAGIEYPAEGLLTPTIPNPSCTHPQGCRCTWL